MNRIIPLWPGRAPYSDESPDQAQPSVKEFRVDGSRGAVVVCEGGGSASVRLEVTRVIQSLTGISADRIVISKMKQ